MSALPTKADISVTGGQGEAATLSGLDLAKSRRAGADGIRDEGWSKMAVVLFHHPRIGNDPGSWQLSEGASRS
jgi:hypothetical protein